jgi:hypothetical protein
MSLNDLLEIGSETFKMYVLKNDKNRVRMTNGNKDTKPPNIVGRGTLKSPTSPSQINSGTS